jgi:hypothetical protein
MRRIGWLLLVSFVGVSLCACGDDAPNKPEDPFEALREGGGDGSPLFPGGLPGGGNPADALRDVMGVGNLELTDEMMASYVEVLKKLKDKDMGSPGEALLTAYDLDFQRWAAISGVIARASMTTNLPEQIEATEKALARARQTAESATDARMKAAFEAQAKGFETQLANLKRMPGPTELDRKNFAVFKRWQERIEAASR